jgi:hypothetical protein
MKTAIPLTVAIATVVLVAACATREPVPLTPPGDAAGAAVIRRPIAEPAVVPAVAAPAAPVAPVTSAVPALKEPLAPIVFPPNTQYVCVSETGGERRQTAIEFASKVAQLCQRHPEMGPCQYERNLCRRSGGRVYAAGGVEITIKTEAEYDRNVMRVRFKAN